MSAGESAQREYDRRRVDDAARLRANRSRLVGGVALGTLLAYAGGLIGAAALNTIVHNSSPRAPSVVSGGTAQLIAGLLALGAFSKLAAAAWGRRQSTEAWRTGATGERATGAMLDRLVAQGYAVFHDLGVPGSKANVDHLVIGPSGVFLVDTKNFKYPPKRSNSQVWSGRYPVKVRPALFEASRVSLALSAPVIPLLCVQGTTVSQGLLQDGVPILDPKTVMRVIERGPATNPPTDVESLAALTRAALHPA